MLNWKLRGGIAHKAFSNVFLYPFPKILYSESTLENSIEFTITIKPS